MDWLEEYGGTLVIIGIVIFFGWLFLSPDSSGNSSARDYSGSYESSVEEDEGYYEEPEEFHGYKCSDDCSGHEAGYEWGYDNDVCYEYSSGDEYWDSHSDSFNEGVTAYIEENC